MYRYIYIDSEGNAYLTGYMIFPNWDKIICIIDSRTKEFTNKNLWPEENEHAYWQEMPEDHL